MKTCPTCGTNNFFKPRDKLECKECGKNLDSKTFKENNNCLSSGCHVTTAKPLHDDNWWDNFNN